MYQLPVASVTNEYKSSGLRQHKFVLIQFRRSEIQHESHWAKVKARAGLVSSGDPGGESVSLPIFFKLLDATHVA